MNALIHMATGLGIALTIADTTPVTPCRSLLRCTAGFATGILVHALLDYAPHCYPVNSKIDFIGSFVLLCLLVAATRRPYRLLIACCLTGAVFPDLTDLLPAILNKQLNWQLPVPEHRLFPWHQPAYSGSIYTGPCGVSDLNIFMVLTAVVATVLWKRATCLSLFSLRFLYPDKKHCCSGKK